MLLSASAADSAFCLTGLTCCFSSSDADPHLSQPSLSFILRSNRIRRDKQGPALPFLPLLTLLDSLAHNFSGNPSPLPAPLSLLPGPNLSVGCLLAPAPRCFLLTVALPPQLGL
ncbi:hypothetical protein RRG08_054749 [Elysia crispata]|uniref:Uncharacterized protein n=1 Tax=Elysia crispata TaxID=231223 RepID=A0AAE1E8D2_9GAST|nr:hypothetical protein RRG08_054749 [Elysia crispata]